MPQLTASEIREFKGINARIGLIQVENKAVNDDQEALLGEIERRLHLPAGAFRSGLAKLDMGTGQVVITPPPAPVNRIADAPADNGVVEPAKTE